MRARTLVAATIAAAFAGGGILYAQPGATPTTGTGSGSAAPTAGSAAPATGSAAPATGSAAPGGATSGAGSATPGAGSATPTSGRGSAAPVDTDVSLPAEKDVKLSPREMSDNAAKLITEMEKTHRDTLNLQAQAKQAKDVIKLNCVNENLLAVKQLLNIADQAKTELTEAIQQSDRSEQIHQYSQVTIAAEKSKEAGNEAQACIGEELHFVGKNDVTVDGPDVPYDPTKDGDLGVANGDDPFGTDLEDPAYASPFSPP